MDQEKMVVDLMVRLEEVGSWDSERGGEHEMPAQMQYAQRLRAVYPEEKYLLTEVWILQRSGVDWLSNDLV
jgi:hypothetical protein